MKPPKLKAVEMVRKIRDRQARTLASKSAAELISYYKAAGEEAVQEASQRAGLRRRKAS